MTLRIPIIALIDPRAGDAAMRILALAALFAATAFAQAFRSDPFTFTTAGQAPPNASVPVLTVPGAVIQICTDAACTVLATTYTSATAGTACPSNAQATLPGTALCRSTSGAQGQWGFWASSGTYYYTVRVNGTRRGPYPVSVGGGGGGGSGTVTSFSVTSVPSWLTASVATATTTPALTLSATGGQTSGRVIGTCGSGTSFAPCALVAGDLPNIPISGGGTGQTTKQPAFNALAPTPTRAGDVTYYNGSNYVNLPGNNSGTRVLQEDSSGVPTWVAAGAGGTVTSVGLVGTANQITLAGTCTIITAGVCTFSIPNNPIFINSAIVNANALTLPAGPTGTLLQLGQTDGATGRAVVDVWGAGGAFTSRRANGTSASPSAILSDNTLSTIEAYGYGTTGYSSSSRLNINLKASQVWTDSAQGSYLQILTTPNGSLVPAVAFVLNQDKTLQVPGYSTGYLHTDSSGNVTAIPAPGTPGGSTTQCQYNNAGVFGGITGCTTDGTTITADIIGHASLDLALSVLAANMATWLANPSSVNLAATMTDKTGTGLLPFGTNPVLVTPRITTVTDGNGNPFIISSATASAVDSITITNAATANPATVTIAASGSDSNVNLNVVAKGTGNVGFPNGFTGGSSPPALTPGTGGAEACFEGTAPSVGPTTGVDVWYCDPTQHGILANFNNVGYLPLVQGPASWTTARVVSTNGTNGGKIADAGFLAADVVRKDAANTGAAAMTLNMGASTSDESLVMPNVAGAANTTMGAMSYDTTNKNVHAGANAVDNVVAMIPAASLPTNAHCAGWSVATNVVRLTDAGVCGSGAGFRGTFTLGTSAIGSGACATVVTVSATGVATTDSISASFNSDPTGVTGYTASTSGMLTIIPYPTSNNVNVKVCNNTGSSITPGAITLNWSVATGAIATGTSALGTSAISSGTCATVVTTSATGTATNNSIAASFNGDPTAVTGYVPGTGGMLEVIAYPTANNVNFKVCNNTTSSITPGAITLNWRVL